MESGTEILVKRPRINIVPSVHLGAAPELWVGSHRYKFDEVTALYFMSVLTNYIYNVAHRDKGPSTAMHGD